MIYTIYRITAPILDRIPDVSQFSQKRQVTIGLLASIGFHLILLLFALAVSIILPDRLLVKFATPKAELQEIEVTILPPEPEPTNVQLLTMDQIQNPSTFIDSLGLNASEKAPENPVFESDVNMVAASELPATGSVPLPSQQGRTDRNFPAFTTQQYLLGKTPLPFPVDPSNRPPSPPSQPAAAPAAPRIQPQPIPQPKPEPAPPQPEEAPLPKTAEMPKVETNAPEQAPTEDDIAVLKKPDLADRPRPVPLPPTSTPLPRPMMRTTAPIALLTTPVPETKPAPEPPPPSPDAMNAPPPSPPQPDGFQPQQQKTHIEGSISNQGRNSVDAIGTPLGRYQKAAKAAIGSRWYYYVGNRLDLYPPGIAKVSFEIDGKGRIHKLRVEVNTSNSSYANVCERSVREAEIPPIPPDVLNVLPNGRLDMSFSFNFNTF